MKKTYCPIARKLVRAILSALDDFAKVAECEKTSPVELQFAIGLVTNKTTKQNTMKVTLTNEQKVKITLAPKTATGKPVSVENVKWDVVSGDSTVKPSEDGLSADVISSDTPGTSQLLVTADADLSGEVREISATLEIAVQGAQAEVLGIEIGTPTAK